MKIATVIGARPQFIKAAALSAEIANHPSLEEIIIHTGQHFDDSMSQIFFDELQIPKPTHQLDINSLTHGAMTGRMLEALEKIFIEEKPDWVLVYGDTNSTIAAALAAAKLHIPIAHVEAGLRSFNKKMPEEINRVLCDHISTLLFCPTEEAIQNLKKEGIDEHKIKLSGDIMFDMVLKAKDFLNKKSAEIVSENILAFKNKKYALATIHRAENTDELKNLNAIIQAFNEINTFTPLIVPLHPRSLKIINEQSIQLDFQVMPPLGYFDMMFLLQNAEVLFTDSGGLQKEAYFMKTPCITLRNETEWIETLNNSCNTLVGADKEKIVNAYHSLQNIEFDFSIPYYGDGHTSAFILQTLENFSLQ